MNTWSIIRLSWKNVWRNPVRSSVVIASVMLAIWSGVFIVGFMNGMTLQFKNDQLDNYTSHIQIHNREYIDEIMPSHTIHDADALESELRAMPFVEAFSMRSVVNGLASSANNTYGVVISGVDVTQETQVTAIHTFLTEGDYLDASVRNPVLIGTDLAQRLSLTLRSRIILTFQDIEGNITAGAFRVTGIYRTPNTSYNERHVVVRSADLNRLLGAENAVHEIAIKVDDFSRADEYARSIAVVTADSVRSWGAISPTLRYLDSNMAVSMYIIIIIIVVALCFGIVNTMLMAVLDRTQELGMLRAIGLNKRRTFLMIMTETLFLTMVGAPFGLFLSWISIYWLGITGIDLSMFSEGLEMYGFSSMVYPALSLEYYLNVVGLMFFATLFASIFPSLKALKLNPVEAIRKV